MRFSPRDDRWIVGILKFSLVGCFLGHGAFGVITKAAWLPYFAVAGIPAHTAWRLMPWIGWSDIATAALVILWPCRALLAWASVWTVWTALLRPLAGQGVWGLIERAGNYGVPLALLAVWGWRSGWFVRGWRSTAVGATDHRRLAQWILRIAGALVLAGHGGYGLIQHQPVLARQYAMFWPGGADALVAWIGAGEFVLAGFVLLRPTPGLLGWACAWKVLSEMLYPVSGSPYWEVVERSGSYGVLLALALLLRTASDSADGRERPAWSAAHAVDS